MSATGTLVGHIGNPGALEQVGPDNCKCGFTLATNHRAKAENGEWIDVPTWWTVTAWGKHAEYISPRIEKGLGVTVINGEFYMESWKKRDGSIGTTLRCKAGRVIFHKPTAERSADGPPRPPKTTAPASAAPPATRTPPPTDDEPPF